MSDLGSPNKRPRNQYSLTTFTDVGADNDGNDSYHHPRSYGTKAKPKPTLPAFKPLTITKHVDRLPLSTEGHGPGEAARCNSSAPQLQKRVDGHGGLDRFLFQGGNGMKRAIRTQQSGGSRGNGEGSARYQPQDLLPTTAEEEEMEEYGWDVGNHMVDYGGLEVKNDSRGIQVEDTGGMEKEISTCRPFNNASQGLGGRLFEQEDTQSKILVEEEGLHSWDGLGGDYIILTPSQSNAIFPYEEELPVLGNTPEPFSDDYFTAPEIPSELQPLEDVSFLPLNNHRELHPDIVAERFTTPSDVTLSYGDESPEVFDPNLPCSASSDGEKLPEHNGGLSDEEYDVFDDDDLWKEVAKKDFCIPPNSDPASGVEEELEEGNPIEPTYAEELESYTEPLDIDLELQKGKTMEVAPAEAFEPTSSRKKGMERSKAPLPPTLISPISHMSNSNPLQPLVNPSAKRIVVFQQNSPRLARIMGRLEVLQSLDEDIPKPPRPPTVPVERSGIVKKWAHLSPEERRKPFVRLPPPEPVKDRSCIEGLSARTMVRVCFRVGEAIRFSNMNRSSDGRGGSEILTELFARVTFSERIGVKQNIQFGDIYHDHPPFLSGSYNLFRACPLWDSDSADLLGEQGKGKMVRVVGRVKKVGFGVQEGMHRYWIEVLSVWECGWEHVERARGVVCGW